MTWRRIKLFCLLLICISLPRHAIAHEDDWLHDDEIPDELGSTNPIESPSDSPTSSSFPTASPSISISPSTQPSLSPSITPSISSSPSTSPSIQPSSPPTELTSTQPSLEKALPMSRSYCRVSGSGFYGEETTTNLTPVLIRYKYQMEYWPNSNEDQLDQALREVENAISNSILTRTSIFAECSDRRRTLLRSTPSVPSSSRRNLQHNILAMTSEPADVPNEEICPFDKIYPTGTACVVLDGILTLFVRVDGSRRLDASADEIRSIIKSGMDLGILQASLLRDDVSHLDYIPMLDAELGGNGNVDNSEQGAEKGNSSVGNSLSSRSLGYVLFAASGLILFVGFTALKWRQVRWKQIDKAPSISSSNMGISILDDDSTNFISSKDVSETSFLNKWRMNA